MSTGIKHTASEWEAQWGLMITKRSRTNRDIIMHYIFTIPKRWGTDEVNWGGKEPTFFCLRTDQPTKAGMHHTFPPAPSDTKAGAVKALEEALEEAQLYAITCWTSCSAAFDECIDEGTLVQGTGECIECSTAPLEKKAPRSTRSTSEGRRRRGKGDEKCAPSSGFAKQSTQQETSSASGDRTGHGAMMAMMHVAVVVVVTTMVAVAVVAVAVVVVVVE
jgi:hypothetical protein